jgi:hypothetical protein
VIAGILGELAGVLSDLRDLGLEVSQVEAGGWTLIDSDGDAYGHALGDDLLTAAGDLLWQYRAVESLALAGYEVSIRMDDGEPQAPEVCELLVDAREVLAVHGAADVRHALEACIAWAAEQAASEWPELVAPTEEC